MKRIAPYQRFLEEQNGKFGFVDGNGHLIIECIYDEIVEETPTSDNPNERYFKEGIARVRINNDWGFINEAGKTIGEIKYKKINRFGPDYAFVQDEKWQIMDRHGRIYGEFDFEEVRELSEQIAVVQTKCSSGEFKYGYIHSDGRYLCNTAFDRAEDFSNGYGVAWVGSKAYYIDRSGYLTEKKPKELYG